MVQRCLRPRYRYLQQQRNQLLQARRRLLQHYSIQQVLNGAEPDGDSQRDCSGTRPVHNSDEPQAG